MLAFFFFDTFADRCLSFVHGRLALGSGVAFVFERQVSWCVRAGDQAWKNVSGQCRYLGDGSGNRQI